MRINYEIKNNIFKICNEYSGIDQFKKTLLKKNKIVTYTKFITLQLISIVFVSLLLYIGFSKINLSIFIDCTTLMLFFVLLQALVLLMVYIKLKKSPLTGTLIIDEYGILDENEYTRSGVAWNQIEAVVESKYAVYVVTKKQNIYVYNKEIIKTMLKEMRFYKRGIKVIKIK